MLEHWLASREDGWLATETHEGYAISLRISSEGMFVWESGRQMDFFTAFNWIFLEGHERRMDEFDYHFLRSYCGEF